MTEVRTAADRASGTIKSVQGTIAGLQASAMSRAEFARLLRDGPRDTPEKRRARERWLDKVSPR
ncbi:MAG: hypothetical protein H0W81_03610 [Chloroflexi bacterium]|nr:hypothetical protein [Chloroflexota bacterium]